MKKEIRQLNKDGSQVQITLADERWYLEEDPNGVITSYPSVTWISQYYPKGKEFWIWLAQHGWNEAEAIKEEAGKRGYTVHELITKLLKGQEIDISDTVTDHDTGKERPIELEEYDAAMSFMNWYNEVRPKTIFNERVVFNREEGYAGTADYLCKIDNELWLIDFKTSPYLYPSYRMQLAAYKRAIKLENPKVDIPYLGILQVGYKRNKHRYKLTKIDDEYELFLAAKRIWQHEAKNTKVFQVDYPTKLKLNLVI